MGCWSETQKELQQSVVIACLFIYLHLHSRVTIPGIATPMWAMGPK